MMGPETITDMVELGPVPGPLAHLIGLVKRLQMSNHAPADRS
jgi:hypothetical protein